MLSTALVYGLLLWGSSHAAPRSEVGAATATGGPGACSSAAKGRRLTGRFLHITDFHPDPYYKTYSSTTSDAACHRHRGPAGIYGAETSGCDSPYSLINETFKWIDENVKNDIDFVVWTGDSSRHDNDEKIPRTQKQIVQQNQFMVDKFIEVFGQDDDKHGRGDRLAVPVVPTFGNNDIMPHNIFLAGPNRWTKKYLDIWRDFIPEEQRHQFQQGGWFSMEVIPGKLAVISLNTMYFFTSNSGVDGCAKKREPGYEHMEWLRIQLQIFRERDMKAILMGHVPPARVDSKESWDETCWQKYTLWQRQFRDVIVGNLYGHMNIDHFMLQDFEQISRDAEKGRLADSMVMAASEEEDNITLYEDGEMTVASASDYLRDLRNAWAELPAPPSKPKKKAQFIPDLYDEEDSPSFSLLGWLYSKSTRPSKHAGKSDKKKYLEKIGGKFAERYSVSHVSPSVVPNYFPALRIIEYNITGLENLDVSTRDNICTPDPYQQQSLLSDDDLVDDEDYLQEIETTLRKKKGKKKAPRKYKFKVPKGPSPSSPPGPAYSPQPLTWTRYIQYYANLTRINNDFIDLSHSPNTHSPRTIFGLTVNRQGDLAPTRWKEGKHHNHQGKQPRPEPHPKKFAYEIEYDTRNDKKFPDLTVRRWVEYARRIGGAKASSALDADSTPKEEEEQQQQHEEREQSELDPTATNHQHKNGKKKKKHKHKHPKASKAWFTFVQRAFVGTMDAREIKHVFGVGGQDIEEMGEDEVMEL